MRVAERWLSMRSRGPVGGFSALSATGLTEERRAERNVGRFCNSPRSVLGHSRRGTHLYTVAVSHPSSPPCASMLIVVLLLRRRGYASTGTHVHRVRLSCADV